MKIEQLAWISPLEAASMLARDEDCWVLLYSGQQSSRSGQHSYLALYPQEIVTGEDWNALKNKLTHAHASMENAWFGYSAYEMLHQAENIPYESSAYIHLPNIWFARFGLILKFDHAAQTITCYREPHIHLSQWQRVFSTHSSIKAKIDTLVSRMSKEEYLEIIAQTKDAIAAGYFYQANITRKFTGTFATTPDAFALFQDLCKASPAVYSALIRANGANILSSSPECFLTIDASGRMISTPIKGTAPRFADPAQDTAARLQLERSTKDRAENLMIVDLMRNDFSRSAVPGSVQVEKLFEVTSYKTLHHMASTVIGQKDPQVSTVDVLRHCFPPGSMTGTPKIKAMQWCVEKEKIRRGVYSGTLGWFGGDGSCDFSVVIRTLIIADNRFEFQVGGGIVADSEPEKEWQETMMKAHGMLMALGIDVKRLEAL